MPKPTPWPQPPRLPENEGALREMDFFAVLAAQRASDEDATLCVVRGAEAEEADLSRFAAQACRFENGRFRGGLFHRTEFTDCLFADCDFSNADFTEAYFNRCHFLRCKAVGAAFTKAVLQHCLLEECNLQYAGLSLCKLNHFRAQGGDLSFANLNECKLASFRLEGLDLRETGFVKTPLKGVDLRKCRIAALYVSDTGAELRGVVVDSAQAAELAKLFGIVVKETP